MKLSFVFAAPAFASRYPEWYLQKLEHADRSDSFEACNAASCSQPSRTYSKILPMQPGYQWGQHGGYCGAWSFQRAALAKGAYISQQQVRDHAELGGGHDYEILATNIDGAFAKLHIKHDNFQYNELPTPQAAEYLKFMKRQLVSGNPLIWMIEFTGNTSPTPGYTMDNTTNGEYAHIEPVVGIMSDHDFSDETVYDDDIFAFFDDASKVTYYTTAKEIPGECDFNGGQSCVAQCPKDSGVSQCMWDQRGYVYAVQDLQDERPAAPISLQINPWASEPYTRGGEPAINITGTLTISDLKKGSSYDIYRWNSAEEAFVYTDANKVLSFTADDETKVWEDPTKFLSSSATYYRCVPADSFDTVV